MNGWTDDYRPDTSTTTPAPVRHASKYAPVDCADRNIYPLYDVKEQRRRFDLGEVTHKRLDQMNRKERRAFATRRRRGQV